MKSQQWMRAFWALGLFLFAIPAWGVGEPCVVMWTQPNPSAPSAAVTASAYLGITTAGGGCDGALDVRTPGPAVNGECPDGGCPTGTVRITNPTNTQTYCTMTTASDGRGSCTIAGSAFPSPANVDLVARYAGAAGWQSAVSALYRHEVRYVSRLTITSDSPDPSVASATHASYNYTVAVSLTNAAGTALGAVGADITVSDGAVSCTVDWPSRTSCVLPSPSTGSKTLTARFPGDSAFGASSDTEAHTVNAPPPVLSAGATMSYTEQESAKAIDNTITVGPASPNVQSATVEITGNFQSGRDVLACPACGANGITASYGSSTGLLSLSGSKSPSTYQTVLRSVTFYNASDAPSGPQRTVTWRASNGQTSSPVTSRVNVTPVDDAPVLTAGAILDYDEGDPATAIDTTITVADDDDVDLDAATVQITAGYRSGQDILACGSCSGLSAAFNASNGTLTITGSQSETNYRNALRSVTYRNSSSDPNTANRAVTWRATSGSATGSGVTSTIRVTASNTPPVLTAGATLAYRENDAAKPIDGTITVANADGANLTGATAQITGNYQNGKDVLACGSCSGITASFNASNGTLTLGGTQSVASYQTALRSVTFFNNSDAPSTSQRTITWIGTDGAAAAPVTSRINVTAVDDPPVLTAGATLAYRENDAPKPVDTTITVANADGANLTGGTAQITGNYQSGKDVLACGSCSGITASFNASNGTLTLSGTQSVASYQTALRSVTFFNNSDTPSTSQRTITWIGNDGTASVPVTSRVNVTAVDDAPVLTAGGTLQYEEGQPARVIDAGIVITNAGPTLRSASARISQNYRSGEDVLRCPPPAGETEGVCRGLVASFDAAAGVLTLSADPPATVATYQAALRSVTYVNTSVRPGTNTRTVTWTATDGQPSLPATSTIQVAAVDQHPEIASRGTLEYGTGQPPAVIDTTTWVRDLDDLLLTAAEILIAPYRRGEDVLACPDGCAGLTSTFDAETGLLRLSGSKLVEEYEAALRSITYVNVSSTPTPGPRTVSWTVRNALFSNSSASTVNVVLMDVQPVLTAGATLAYEEGQPATAIDATVTVTGSATITSAFVQVIAGYESNGDTLLCAACDASITSTYDRTTGTLRLSGARPASVYQAALRSVAFQSIVHDPGAAERTIMWIAHADTASSFPVTSTVMVTPVNDPPSLVAGGTSHYYHAEPPVIVDRGAAVSDPDDERLTRATAQLTANYLRGEDVLACPAPCFGLTAAFDDATGTLTLTGDGPVANYRAALGSITYRSQASPPTPGPRTVEWQASDAALTSPRATSTVIVHARGALRAAVDTFVRGGTSADTAYAALPYVLVNESNSGVPFGDADTKRTLLRFDLPADAPARVERALLRLHVTGLHASAPLPLAVNVAALLDDSWVTNGVTWRTRFAEAPRRENILQTVTIERSGRVEIDVTSFVNAQLAGDRTVSLEVFAAHLLTDGGRNEESEIRMGSSEANDGTGPELLLTGDLPACADGDADGICDAADNCPAVPNRRQENSDFFGGGDACDARMPRDLSAAVDLHVSTGGTFLHEQHLLLGTIESLAGQDNHVLLRVDLASVADAYGVTLAVFNETTLAPPVHALEVYGVLREDWAPEQVTMSRVLTAAPKTAANRVATAAARDRGWILFDVTDYVRGKLSAGQTTASFLLAHAPDGRGMSLQSRELGTRVPHLRVASPPPAGVQLAGGVIGLPPGAGDFATVAADRITAPKGQAEWLVNLPEQRVVALTPSSLGRAGNPIGALRRIDTVTLDATTVVLRTTDVPLTDVIVAGKLEFRSAPNVLRFEVPAPSPDLVDPSLPLPPEWRVAPGGLAANATPCSMSLDNGGFGIVVPIGQLAGLLPALNKEAVVQANETPHKLYETWTTLKFQQSLRLTQDSCLSFGPVEFYGGIDFDRDIANIGVRAPSRATVGLELVVDVALGVTGGSNERLHLKIPPWPLKQPVQQSFTAKVFGTTFGWSVIPVGGVLVVIAPKLDTELGAELLGFGAVQLEAKVHHEHTFDQEIVLKYGEHWGAERGFSFVDHSSKSTTFDPLKLEGSGGFRFKPAFSIKPGIHLYGGLLTGEFFVEVGAEAEAKLTFKNDPPVFKDHLHMEYEGSVTPVVELKLGADTNIPGLAGEAEFEYTVWESDFDPWWERKWPTCGDGQTADGPGECEAWVGEDADYCPKDCGIELKIERAQFIAGLESRADVTLKNGSANVSGGFHLGWEQLDEAGSRLMVGEVLVPSLSAGESRPVAVPLPSVLGAAVTLRLIADAREVVPDGKRDNNVVDLPLNDLEILSARITGVASLGANYELELVVRNNGTRQTNDFSVNWTTVGPDGAMLDTAAGRIAGLVAKEVRTIILRPTTGSASVTAREVQIEVDSRFEVADGARTNNKTSVPAVQQLPDLVPGTFSCDEPYADRTIRCRATMRNATTTEVTSTASTPVRAVFSVVDPDGVRTVIPTATSTFPVPNGVVLGSHEFTFDWETPARAGVYKVWMFVDSTRVIREGEPTEERELNNEAEIASIELLSPDIGFPDAVLGALTFRERPMATTPQRPFTAVASIQNGGNQPLKPPYVVRWDDGVAPVDIPMTATIQPYGMLETTYTWTPSTPAADPQLKVCVVLDPAQHEWSTTNNCRTVSLGKPDLVPYVQSLVKSGSFMIATIGVCNRGLTAYHGEIPPTEGSWVANGGTPRKTTQSFLLAPDECTVWHDTFSTDDQDDVVTFTIDSSNPHHPESDEENNTITVFGGPNTGSCVSWGDPHLTTFDGVSYDFQSQGEFILATTDPATGVQPGELMVQVRQQPWNDSPSVAANTAVATLVGTTKVAVYARRANKLWIDGAPWTGALPVELPAGTISRRDDGSYLVEWAGTPSFLQARLHAAGFLDVRLDLSERLRGRIAGLLGNYNHNPADDFSDRDGVTIDTPPLAAYSLYGEFEEAWRLRSGESLFNALPEDGTISDPAFPALNKTIGDLTATQFNDASSHCRAAGVPLDTATFDACVLDYALTQDEAFVRSAASTTSAPAGGGVLVEIFNTADFQGAPIVTRVDSHIDTLVDQWEQKYGGYPLSNADGTFSNGVFSVRWTAQVIVPNANDFWKFVAEGRIWLDGVLIKPEYEEGSSAYVSMVPGRRYDLRVEYANSGPETGMVRLSYGSHANALVPVPATRLFLPPSQ